MKTRRTKVLLSLLAVIAAGFAVTNAYIFTVENRNPFGVLNLSTLVIKPTTSSESMVLSGYTLKIKTQEGKLKVHRICNELEENEQCIEINNIVGNGGGNGISADGTGGDYCYRDNDGNLMCDNSKLSTIVEAIIDGMDLGTPKDGTLTIKQGDNTRYFSANTGTDVEISLAGGGAGTWQPNLVNQEGYVTAPTNNKTGKVRKTDEDGNPGWRDDDTTSFELEAATSENLGGIKIGYTTSENDRNYAVELNSSTKQAFVHVPRYPGEGGGPTNIVGEHGKRCKYMCDSVTIDGDKYTLTLGKLPAVVQAALNSEGATIEWAGCEIKCTETGATGGGDGEWIRNESTNTITPKETKTTKVAIKDDTPVKVIFDDYGARFFNAMALILTRYNTQWIDEFTLQSRTAISSVTGLAVNGPIAVGVPNNYILMYADGEGDDRHYEIMGRNELAVGTQYGAFLYFAQKTGNYIYHLEPMMYGNATSEGGGTCKPDGETVVGADGGSDPKGVCTNNTNTQASMVHALQPGDYVDAYETFMVGVNTNQPNATLDVYGSLRIGNNCVPATCDQSHAGTMMYYETPAYGGQIAVCALSSADGQYHRNAIKMNEFEEYGSPKSYDRICHAPDPSPHPLPHPEPYVVSEGVATPATLTNDF